jgi:XisI protein
VLRGQFLLIRIGWEKNTWRHDILFHAELIGDKLIIQADLTEGLKPLLLEAGIRAEAFLSDRDYNWREAAKAVAA